MQMNAFYDLVKSKQDNKGYQGAVSVRKVLVETPDSDTFYDVVSLVFDETRGCYVIKVDVNE